MNRDDLSNYKETLGAPDWLRWTLLAALLLIVSTIGVRIGSGTIGGGEGTAAWIAALLSGGALLFVYWNFLTLEVSVAGGMFTFAYGIVRHTVVIGQIESVESDAYRWARYGGWGFSRGPLGRRAWSMPGVKTGVVVVVQESGKRREYFVSSHVPLKLEEAIRAGMAEKTEPQNHVIPE